MQNDTSKTLGALSAKEFEKKLSSEFGQSFDILINRFKTPGREVVLAYVTGMTDKNLVDRDIITPLKSGGFDGDLKAALNACFEESADYEYCRSMLLDGIVLVYCGGSGTVFIVDFKRWDMRSVAMPDSESVIRGPKESFNENLATNIVLIRRKLRTPDLVVKKIKLGKQTNTSVALVYLDKIADKRILDTLEKKLSRLEVDGVLESGQIEQFLEREPLSMLPNMGLTQKPDIVAARILEGRVAIVCDGTPHVLTIPELFVENFSSAEDYYSRTVFTNFLRIFRMFAFYISIFIPGTIVAILNYHQEMVPFVFLNTFVAATQKTPLPEAIEVFLLILVFELIKEGGTRLPKTAGTAITIVGALIIGDAAVNAGIVGAPSVIIVAFSAVASLLCNSLNEFIIFFRLVMLLLGAWFGLIGIGIGAVVMLTYIASKESYGINILTRFSKHKAKDEFFRKPLGKIKFKRSGEKA
jgi:spore germination protein KA